MPGSRGAISSAPTRATTPCTTGRLRFYMTAWLYWLFGESESTARMWAALSGVAVVALPWVWRRDLGPVGTVASVALLAVSPSMLYFSRFGREDSLFLAITLVLVMLLVRFVRRPAPWHPLALLCLVVAGTAVKESIFLVIFVFGAYALALIAQELLVAGSAAPPVTTTVGASRATNDVAGDDDSERADADAADGTPQGWIDRFDAAGQRRLVLVVALLAMIIAFFFGEPIFVSLGVYGLFLTTILVAALLRARRRGVDLAEVPVLRSLVAVPLGMVDRSGRRVVGAVRGAVHPVLHPLRGSRQRGSALWGHPQRSGGRVRVLERRAGHPARRRPLAVLPGTHPCL